MKLFINFKMHLTVVYWFCSLDEFLSSNKIENIALWFCVHVCVVLLYALST